MTEGRGFLGLVLAGIGAGDCHEVVPRQEHVAATISCENFPYMRFKIAVSLY
jgi:hypothetical protein